MPSYETDYKSGASPQGYSLDQYEASDSSSNSPKTHYSLSCLKTRENYPTPSTDSSNEPDDSVYFNYPFNSSNTFLKMGENNIASNFFYNGNQLEQFFNSNEARANMNGENYMQSYGVANFDANFVPNKLSTSSLKSEPEKKATRLSKSPAIQNTESVSQQYLMQPPDSDSIEAATANAKKKRPQRRSRTKFEKEQLDILESTFQKTHYPDVNMIDRISRMCNLTTERISVWFQNRRARFKRTKKGQKEEPVIPDHNPILEELGLYNSSELERNNINTFDESKIGNPQSPLNENTNESETNQSEENLCQPQKPLFNPLTLPTSKTTQNSSQNYYMQFNKIEPYYYQDENNQLEKSQMNEPTDEHSSSSSPSSRNSSPKPQSNNSTPSPNPDQSSENTYAQLPSVINQYNSLPSMMNYQSGFGNFYMPPIQSYAQNLPSIFQPYMDHKPDISNLGYFHGFNPQALPSYYGGF